jgi:hypothetical protein
MKAESCRGWRELIGVYVLGQLDERHSSALIAHLDGCPACRAEVRELSAVAHLLPAANPLHEDARPSLPPHLESGILERVRNERRTQLRTRVKQRTVTTLVAAAALAVGLGIGSFLYSPENPSADPHQKAHITFATSSDVTGAATLEYLPWGTRIDLSARGLKDGVVYEVSMEKTDGGWIDAGTFKALPSREMHVTLAAAIERDDCKAIEVRSPNGNAVLHADTPWATNDAGTDTGTGTGNGTYRGFGF